MNGRIEPNIQFQVQKASILDKKQEKRKTGGGSKEMGGDENGGIKNVNRRRLNRENKMATLLQDVDKLKKKLRHEENVHRALKRAFTRPLGALPRLPPHLPPSTLELLAEVAVLEEEVVWLTERVVNFRQDLYQESIFASPQRNIENFVNDVESMISMRSLQHRESKSLASNELRLPRPIPTYRPQLLVSNNNLSDQTRNAKQNSWKSNSPSKENQLGSCYYVKDKSSPQKKTTKIISPSKKTKTPTKHEVEEKSLDAFKLQTTLFHSNIRCVVSAFSLIEKKMFTS